MRGRGFFVGAGGTYIRMTSAGIDAAEAGTIPTAPGSPAIYIAGDVHDSAIEQGTIESSQSLAIASAALADPAAPAEPERAVEAVNLTFDGHPMQGRVTYGMRARNTTGVPLADIVIWLVRRAEELLPEDTPHATDQYRIATLEPESDWAYFHLTQTPPFETPHVFRDAAIVASWREPTGVRRGEVGSTHVF